MKTTRTSSILPRNISNGYQIELGEADGSVGGGVKNPYPSNAPGLVQFMFLLHDRRGLVPPRKFVTYLREAKKLIDEIGPDRAEVAMRKAARVSNHPWGMGFVRKCYLD